MLPILLIHGYSSEGEDNTIEEIYGRLPEALGEAFGADVIKELNLSRWISLNDGIRLDDVSFAMHRALTIEFPELLKNGFHVIIHSTGALVVRNWIQHFSPKPSPILNLVHLAGANFGSGLAHIGRGQLSRWGRYLAGTGRGTHILNELEFGAWKTLDMHGFFLEPENDMYHDYQVQEFCIIGSQTLSILRVVPIRYVKEDSSDNTVRTSAGNLNFNYISVQPNAETSNLTRDALADLVELRKSNKSAKEMHYKYDLSLSDSRQQIPFTIAYETAHYGDDIGIVTGKKSRRRIIPLIKKALETPYDLTQYNKVADEFNDSTKSTFARVGTLKTRLWEWNKQAQYEAHAQLIFRLKDQFGQGVKDFDITIKTSLSDKKLKRKKLIKLESLIEDDHVNKKHPGTITFYLRTQMYKEGRWIELLEQVAPVKIEVTASETASEDIDYVPLTIELKPEIIRKTVQSFQTTIIDITMARLPSQKVFDVKKIRD